MNDDIDHRLARQRQVLALLEAWHDREALNELLDDIDDPDAWELLLTMGAWFARVLDFEKPGFREHVLAWMHRQSTLEAAELIRAAAGAETQ